MKKRKNKGKRRNVVDQATRKIFVISEGEITEPSYISALKRIKRDCDIEVVMSGSKNIGKMKREVWNIKRMHGRSSEIWIVVDMNSRTESQLSELYKAEVEYKKVKVALSNPFFEIWLLFHYDEGRAVYESSTPEAAKTQCIQSLKNVGGWEGYDKEVIANLITEQNILVAVERAKKRDTPRCKKWPRKLGTTTFYRLVESYLNRK